jgi:hypothetical protein
VFVNEGVTVSWRVVRSWFEISLLAVFVFILVPEIVIGGGGALHEASKSRRHNLRLSAKGSRFFIHKRANMLSK